MNDAHLPVILDAVAVLPAIARDTPGDRYGVQGLTAAWLADFNSDSTRRGYFGDLMTYLGWCEREGLNPLAAQPADVAKFKLTLTEAPTTINRRLSALGSWYKYLGHHGKTDANPIAVVRRPKVDRDASTAVGLTVDEVRSMLRVADAQAKDSDGLSLRTRLTAYRNRAMLRLLTDMGMRRAEVVSLDVDSLGKNRGHQTVRYSAKGGKLRERALAAHVIEAIDDYLEIRGAAEGPLFVSIRPDGGFGRIDHTTLFRMVRMIGRAAGIEAVDRMGPHTMRHAFATHARDLGIALEDVQDAMGHADPRTTRRYDRARHALSREPGLRIGAVYADEEI